MKKISSFIFEILETAVIAIAITLILIYFVIYPIEIDGSSMYSTLGNGDVGFSFICAKLFGIKRFDTVIIVSDKSENKLIKRVIGMPNECISYIDSKLYIDGEYIEEDFLDDDVVTNDFTQILGDDEYFCLGDNREVSRDSRYYGPFNSGDFKSLHAFIICPFENMGYKK